VAAAPRDAQLRLDIRTDTWRGNQFPVVWMQPKSEQAPLPPGIHQMPTAGQWYISPALEKIVRSEPALAARFPDGRILTEDGVLNPGELIAYRRLPSGGALGENSIEVVGFGGGRWFIGDPVDLEPAPIVLAAGGLVGIPVIILMAAALSASSPVRAQRLTILSAIGIPSRHRIGVLALEALLAAGPGLLVGTVIWGVVAPNLTALPFVGRPITPGELMPPLAWVVVTMAGTVGVFVTVSVLVQGLQRRTGGNPRPVVGRSLLRPARWVPVAAGAVLLLNASFHSGKGASISALGGLLLVTAGLPLILPIIARAAGRSVAANAYRPTHLLAGRRLERSPLAAVRPLFGLAAILVIAPVVATWMVSMRQLDDTMVRDQQIEAARVTGAIGGIDLTAVASAVPRTIVARAGMSESTSEEAPVLRLFTTCAQLHRTLGRGACSETNLSANTQERLSRVLGTPADVELATEPADHLRSAGFIVIVGLRSPTFEPAVRAAALNQPAAVSVFSEADAVQRESPLVAWILGGVTLLGVLLFAAFAVSLIDRTVSDCQTRRLLGFLGLRRAQIRSVQIREFSFAYLTVAGTALVAGLGCSVAWHSLNPAAPYPVTSVAGLVLAVAALAGVVVSSLRAVRTDSAERPSLTSRV